MARLQVSKMPMNQDTWDKFMAAAAAAVQKFDFDSTARQKNGLWLPTPASGIVYHDLTAIPKWAAVKLSDSADGDNWFFTTYWSVGRTSITIEGAGKPYCEVLLNL